MWHRRYELWWASSRSWVTLTELAPHWLCSEASKHVQKVQITNQPYGSLHEDMTSEPVGPHKGINMSVKKVNNYISTFVSSQATTRHQRLPWQRQMVMKLPVRLDILTLPWWVVSVSVRVFLCENLRQGGDILPIMCTHCQTGVSDCIRVLRCFMRQL